MSRQKLTPLSLKYLRAALAAASEASLPALSGYLSYSLVLALLPLAAFLLYTALNTALPAEMIFSALQKLLPAPAYDAASQILLEIAAAPKMPLALPSFFGFTAMGVRAVLRTADICSGEPATRGGVKLFALSFLCALLVSAALLVALSAGVLWGAISSHIQGVLGWHDRFGLLSALRTLFAYFSIFFLTSLLYAFAPAKRVPLRSVRRGAGLSAAALLAGTLIFAEYVERFGRYGLLFGSLRGIFILLVWLYWCSYILLFGVFLNRALREAEATK